MVPSAWWSGRIEAWWEHASSALDSSADKKLFEVKRKDQMNALKNLIELNDVNQQYKIIDIMLKGLFKVLEDSRAVLIAADVPPDGPFPQDEKIKDAYSHVVENTAFFGDVVLRFPKIVHHYFDRNSNWNSLIRWGISFCNLTGVFEQGPHSQVLGLMAQELGISEKSPDYRNPFKTDHSESLLFSRMLRPRSSYAASSLKPPTPWGLCVGFGGFGAVAPQRGCGDSPC
ncbi:coiled-coil domain-containing protein 134 isoform X1 [Pogoniulus pusillus]|uniref:coiled-coil domain-containing protein 134 isoform X1 n=1 Tax=Pogoniulus pusillus TaxID=488313 RepID=UPI0030B9796B